ncbi:TetR/AcrR family transcriptional regulator [Bartonella apis]|uniref:TetR/AcrR family transcriptional regulator n=1 Tax=Bartonella apis TaxID=1686310 RepID=UPI00242DADC0|nr:TetR/AcrR family transcriptional regulator [Bartonella apis]
MTEPAKKLSRGRPPTISRDRIIKAAIEIGLPKITFVGVAEKLGVSHMALYNHVDGLEALKKLVAETIFLEWKLPQFQSGISLHDYLVSLASSMWKLVETYQGITPYLLRRDMITPAIEQKITEHQHKLATAYQLPFIQAHWLAFTISYHTLSIADSVLPDNKDEDDLTRYRSSLGIPNIDDEYAVGLHALIIGSLSILDRISEKSR